MKNPFRYFNSSPEIIRLTVMLYIRYPLSLRQIEDLLFERGIDIPPKTVRFGWNRFGLMFAAEIRKHHIPHRLYSRWRWHLDEVFVRINGETHYLWRAVDHEGEVFEVFAMKRRDRSAALKFLKRVMKRCGRPLAIVTDRLRSYRSAMKVIGNATDHRCGRWLNNRAAAHTCHFEDERARWRDSGASRPCKRSLPLTPRSKIISTRTATSTAAISSSRTVPIRSRSGINLTAKIWGRALRDWFKIARHRRDPRCAETMQAFSTVCGVGLGQ